MVHPPQVVQDRPHRTLEVSRPRLVILRALGIGDLLAGVPALRGLARSFPDHHRTLIAPETLHPLVQRLGVVDDLAVVGRDEMAAPVPWRPSAAVNLHGSGPHSHRALTALQPDRLMAFRHQEVPESGDGPPLQVEPEEHERARWCRLLSHYQVPARPGDFECSPDWFGPAPLEGVTVLHPSASTGARRWPVENWVKVARGLTKVGHRVVVTGSQQDAEICQQIVSGAQLPVTANVSGRWDLLQLMAVVGAARLVVSGDTGIAHMAVAQRTPSVILFGPVAPALWGPPLDRPWHRVLWSGQEGETHTDCLDPGLASIASEAVMDECERALAVSSAG